MTVTPYTPWRFLELAKHQISVDDKITTLRRMIDSFPLDAASATARGQLIELLEGTNRYEEALQIYQQMHPTPGSGDAIDFKLLDCLLKTGRYADVLRATSHASGPVKDFQRDERLLELQVQALLAKGRYHTARESVDQWLAIYSGEGTIGSRFEPDVRSIRFLQHHLHVLERMQGPEGKPLFTAAVPDSFQHWSQRADVPIVFFKLIPAHPSGQIYEPVLPGRYETDPDFQSRVDELNKGFHYLSGGNFSVAFQGVHTLYVGEGDMDPVAAGGHLLTSRVYVHTIPELYRLAGNAFVILVDYRAQAEDEAAYMGDGLIHISAGKLKTLVLMHEILHGLGATHRDWSVLESQGYQFDPEDRGLMTFEQGEILNLGLEEKNRATLGWPHVAVLHFSNGTPLTMRSEPVEEATATAPADPMFPESGSAMATNTAPEQNPVGPGAHDLARLPI